MKNKRTYAIYVADSTRPVEEVISTLMKMAEQTGCERVRLHFGNWDADPRELYDIPEMQKWCREFIQKGGLSLVDRLEDVPPGLDLSTHLPSQLLLVACSGLPGATRAGKQAFTYDVKQIAALERQYRS